MVAKVVTVDFMHDCTTVNNSGYICFWMGMQKYLAAAYTCGMFDFTGKELCEWILRFFYSFWGYEKNVIDKMIEEVKEVYQKYPVQADNGFHVHIMPEGTEPEDTVTEYVRENRKQFLEHYEEWEQKRNKKMSRKKKSIYEQCRHMFWENGYEKTTYKEISSTIKISQGLIAYHFGKKINIAYEIYEDCKRQKEEMIQKMKDMFSEEEDFKLGRLMRAYMLHIKGGEKYEKLLYGMMQEQEYFQLKLLEIESEARTIEKFNPDKPMLRRVIITVIHGIEDELIWKNFQKSYSNTKDGADMLEADVMIHNCLETDDIIIWYRKMIEDVKNYLEEWEITIEEDFILKCRKK